jgi:hypothetical protein
VPTEFMEVGGGGQLLCAGQGEGEAGKRRGRSGKRRGRLNTVGGKLVTAC